MNTRKITAALMAAMLFAGAIPAATADADEKTGVLKAETVAVTLDQLEAQDYQVPVKLFIEENPGFAFMSFGFSYDERLTVENYMESGVLLETENGVIKGVGDNPDLHLVWAGIMVNADAATSEPVYCRDDGEYFLVTFKVPEDAKEGDVFEIEMLAKTETAVQELSAENNTAYNCGLVNGAIVIGDETAGDALKAEAEANAAPGGEADGRADGFVTTDKAEADEDESKKENDIPPMVLIIGGVLVLTVIGTAAYVIIGKKKKTEE